ncbi:MAG: HAMP domain-containing protein [Candidatus Thorarchaeota archaeon]
MLGFATSQDIIDPLNRAISYSKLIAEGDLTVDSYNLKSRRTDELGQLNNSFAVMVESLQAIVEEISVSMGEINATAQELAQLDKGLAALVSRFRLNSKKGTS